MTPTAAVFPTAGPGGMYESFYLRAVSPDEPLGVWIRHTIHQRPGQAPRGSVWFTLFDASQPRPLAHKETFDDPSVPPGGWIAVGGSSFGPDGAEGSCGPASWSLRTTATAPPLRHLRRSVLYRAPVPRTKLTSPMPLARLDGEVRVGERTIDVRGWPGMVGHNWGAEHAERWVWLHGAAFEQDPGAWIDVAVGRILVGGRLTPWVANGAVEIGGRRHAIGGLLARGVRVDAHVGRAELSLPGPGGLRVIAQVTAPREATVGWRYADPDGGEHDVANCSIAALSLTVEARDGVRHPLTTGHGGAYELGMRERDHGLPIEPFGDGWPVRRVHVRGRFAS